jgi:aspartyl protease family protein
MRATFFIVIVAAAIFASIMGNSPSQAPSGNHAVLRANDTEEREFARDGAETSSNQPAGTVELDREADGHFYADVQVNGATLHMLVDTGATIIALSREDARSAGLATSIGMPEVVGRGADGDVHGEIANLDRVSLGQKTAEGLPAVVLNSGEQSLLGQSFLSKFQKVEIQGDKMLLQ